MALIPAEAFVLAGGASRRFGADKARYILDGKPMLVHIAGLLDNLFLKVAVVAKADDDYSDLGYTTLADNYPLQAPISGLLTALESAASEWIFVAPCDTPYLDQATIELLWDGRSGKGAIPQVDARRHPLTAFKTKN